MFHVKQLTVNDVNYEIVDEGQGMPLLLLHGFPDSKKLWYQMIPELTEQGYRVIAPDLRGYGNTDMTVSYKIEDSARDMFDLLAYLDITNAHVIGHDWGAFLGWYLAAQYPTLVDSYVALSVGHPNGYLRGGGARQMMKGSYIGLFVTPGISEKLISAGDFRILGEMAENERLRQNWYMDLARPGRLTSGLNWYRHNISAILGSKLDSVMVPVMGIIGKQDPALTTAQMKASERYVYSSFDYHEIDAGHWMPETHPEVITKLILDFLSLADLKKV
ncbi:alpha/beta fold hydrolase [Macrococcus carouselicus]|nr:alpha/beta fold hydrolase [Macrococcus carouselicus]